jgi:hypothetical protein
MSTLRGRAEAHARLRNFERGARRAAVAFVRVDRRHGASGRGSARTLSLSHSTLWDWCAGWASDRLAARELGRTLRRLTRGMREMALCALKLLGRRVDLSLLKALVPEASRSALTDVLVRARAVWRRRNRWHLFALRWPRVGAVWACDFTDPDRPMQGDFVAIFVVRDLASGATLASEPLVWAGAAEVERVLLRLFEVHGAPLVLKHDNGKALTAWNVQLLLSVWGVLELRSPPRLPRYNGSCEAGIGSLSVLIDQVAAAHGRAGRWSCDDVEAARQLGNHSADAPLDPRRTPADLWDARTPITRGERTGLGRLYRTHEAREREQRGLAAELELADNEQASIDRVALGHALVVAGYLEERWRSICPPI